MGRIDDNGSDLFSNYLGVSEDEWALLSREERERFIEGCWYIGSLLAGLNYLEEGVFDYSWLQDFTCCFSEAFLAGRISGEGLEILMLLSTEDVSRS